MSDDSFKGIDWNKALMLPEWEPVLEMLKEHRSETIRLACSNPMPNIITRHNIFQSAIDRAVAAEREACAKIADSYESFENDIWSSIAHEIRVRGEKVTDSAQIIGQGMAKSAIEHWEGLWE